MEPEYASAELAAKIDSGAAPPILDVRSALEYRHGHVPGAQHIPFWQLPFRTGEIRAAKTDTVVVYCGHGPRASLAAAILRRAGFTRVACLAGHWSGWSRERRPEEQR